MSEQFGIITSFTKLDAWREGHALVLLVYTITRGFPKEELFGLVMQMRRSAVSITSNIAEGFSRFSYKEKIQFYFIALGLLTELQNQLLVAKDVGFMKDSTFEEVALQAVRVSKILNGLIKKSKSFIPNS